MPHSYIFGAKDIYSALMKNLLLAVLLLSATTVAAQQSTIKGNSPELTAQMNGQMANLYLITTSGQKMLLTQNIRSSGKEVFNISGPSGVYHLVLEGSDSKSLNTVKIVVSR
jgi:hypothetical protein